MTGFDSKRKMALAKLTDDDGDTQAYSETLLIVYQRGFADGKKAQPVQEPFSSEAIRATQTAWKMGYEAAKAEMAQQALEALEKLKKSEDLLEESVKALKAKLDDDDDAQGYIAGYETALKIAYEIGFDNGKKAQRKPLTDESIWQIATDYTTSGDLHAYKFARAIEAAHNIKEGT